MHCTCGKQVESDNYIFCPYCGKKYSDDSPPDTFQQSDMHRLIPKRYLEQVHVLGDKLASERRIVTIMFVDIVGSTSMSETRDPEEVIDIVNSAFKVICKPIQNLEGTIARFMGDGLLCFFGAPDSHKDDPQRACEAGLEIIKNISLFAKSMKNRNQVSDFAVRIGINTDLVVVGEVGTDNRVEYTAMGDGINIAARLEQMAEPNSVLISEKTKRYIETKFETALLGDFQIKGISKPVPVYKLLQGKDKRSIIHSHISESPFIGRNKELDIITKTIRDVSNTGGSLITISGEAGIGKSRLLDEAYINFPPQMISHFINCSTSTSDKPGHLFSKIISFLKRDIGKSDTDMIFEEKPDKQSKDELLSEYRQLVNKTTPIKPVIFSIDDFQWADTLSIELLKSVIPAVKESKIILILSNRMDNESMTSFYAGLSTDIGCHHNIKLPPLNHDEVELLFKDISAQHMMPPKVKKVICENSNGNPFFLKVLIKSVLEPMLKMTTDDKNSLLGYHVDTIKIPRSLQGAVMSRVDQLHPLTKMILKYASVMGGEIDVALLKHVTKSSFVNDNFKKHMADLVDFGYLTENDNTYHFSNKLEAESIYKSLLRSQREELRLEVDQAREVVYKKT